MIYQLRIIAIKGEERDVDVANSEEEFRNTTVKELRRKIEKYFFKDNDYHTYRLIYTHRGLQDDDTLGDHGIGHMDTLFVVLHLPGGGGPLPEKEDGGIHRTESMEKLKLSM